MPLTFKPSPYNIPNPFKNKKEMGSFCSLNYFTLWHSSDPGNERKIFLGYGIRQGHQWQLLPIKNTSNENKRALMFGTWKIFLEIGVSF